MPLAHGVGLVSDAVVAAARRGVPLVGMRLDFDLTILDAFATRLFGTGLVARGWRGPVLDAGVIDRHVDPDREGRRTLGDLCGHYGIELARPHDAVADAVAAIEVLYALAARYPSVWSSDPAHLHDEQTDWHRQWMQTFDGWRRSEGIDPVDPREHAWPLAPLILPAAA